MLIHSPFDRNISQKSSVVLLSVILFFLTGCTLSMDEWIETEETKGYDNMETVQNDFYSLEYEYKSTTRSLTEEIQKYIVQVESDSIIYFMDNTPSDWLPKAGGQVVANCCELFPMGLMGHVLSVEKQNGLVKVVTSGAELEDCFEDFNLDFNTDLLFNNQEQDSVFQAAARGQMTRSGGLNEQGEVVYRDWTMFNAMKEGHRPVTRGLEDEYKEDVDKESSDTKEMMIFELAYGDEVGKAIAAATKNAINTIDVKLFSVTKTSMHKIIELKRKREYTSSTTYNGYKLRALVGKDFSSGSDTEEAMKQRLSSISDMIKNTETFKKFNYTDYPIKPKKPNLDVDELEFTVEIPLGTLPFGIIIRLKPVLEFHYGLFGEANLMHWTSGTKTTTEVIDGDKTIDESKELKTRDLPTDTWNVNAFGGMSLSGGAELFIGVGKRLGKKAAGIGAFVALTANLAINITPVNVGDCTLASSNDAFNIDGKLTFGGKILTAGWFGDISFLTHDITLASYTKHYHPLLDVNTNRPLIPDEDEKGPYEECNVSYKFTDIGMHSSGVWVLYNKPIMAVYTKDPYVYGDYDKPDQVIVAKDFGNSSKIKKDVLYEFTFKNYQTGKPIYLIPGVKDAKGNLTFYKQYQSTKQNNKPLIQYDVMIDTKDYKNYDYLYQLSGSYQDRTMYGYLDPTTGRPRETHWWGYKYMLPFILHNASSISKYWSDWGVYTSVNGGKVFGNREKYISLAKNITSSGKYAIEFSFSYTSNQYNPQNYPAQAYVYYVKKGESQKRIIKQSKNMADYEFSYHLYKTVEKDPGEIWLKTPINLQNFYSVEDEYPDFNSWFSKYKRIYKEIGSY